MKLPGFFTPSPQLAVALLLAFAPLPSAAQTIETLGVGFNDPIGVAVDGSGNVFVADFRANAVRELPAAAGYTTAQPIGAAFGSPVGIALDGSGNLYVAAKSATTVTEVLASGGYTTTRALGSGFNQPTGVAVDGSGNVFVADAGNNAVKEILAAGGYTTIRTLGNGFKFNFPAGVALDAAGDVFVADSGNNAVEEILAAGGYATVKTLGGGFNQPSGVALDGSGNVFVADAFNNSVKEILAAGGYATVIPFGIGFNLPQGVAVDNHGNVFVGDSDNAVVKEMPAASAPIVASVLPGSRSVQLGNPATIFASVINSGTNDLGNCQVRLSQPAPAGLTFDYQTTNPNTNALIGAPDTPVTIAGNKGLQTFLVTFHGATAFSAPAMPLEFVCAGSSAVNVASVVPGVDTVDLVMSGTPVADIIALAATPSGNGILGIPVNGAAAFAVASTNVGATTPITVSVDTGTAALPLALSICQSNPGNGQCLAPAASSTPLNYAGGAAPTFSVFAAATGPIAFAPAASRIFVRFKDSSGGLHGSTSVAIDAP